MTYEEWRSSCPLRVWMRKRKVSRSAVAVMTGVSESAVGYWCQGSKSPSSEKMVKLAAVMGTSPSTLTKRWVSWKNMSQEIAV